MVLYVSVQLSLLTCFLTAVCSGSAYEHLSLPFHLSDEAQEDEGVQCGKNMSFKTNGSYGEGSCVCSYDARSYGWGRPQFYFKADNSCWNIGERGPCPQGLVLEPVGMDIITCGFDACASKEPKNPVSHSEWSAAYPNDESLFDFTYKGECYRTETQGFCGEGQVVRFRNPLKNPMCEPRATEQDSAAYSGSALVPISCGAGLVPNNVGPGCVLSSNVDFAK